jgi:hypothetical protein
MYAGKGTTELPGAFWYAGKVIERTSKAMERELVQCVRQSRARAALPQIAMRERSA